ncbi:MAG: thiolase family protein [Propionibacteriaceae bacterium]|nr:thiolase family protein [Propionibacteriaceae bacterium]
MQTTAKGGARSPYFKDHCSHITTNSLNTGEEDDAQSSTRSVHYWRRMHADWIRARSQGNQGFTEGELLSTAVIEAVEDAGIDVLDIDSFNLGQLGPNVNSNMAGGAGELCRWMGMSNKEGFSHDECCSTASVGLHRAIEAVASGRSEIVLSANVNINLATSPQDGPALPQLRKPTDPNEFGRNAALWVFELNYGFAGSVMLSPLDGWGGLYARKHGYSREQMWEAMNNILVLARQNAYDNPLGLLADETYAEEAERMGFDNAFELLNDPMMNPRICTLMRARDNSPAADGAAAVIVCSTEKAKQIHSQPIEVAGFASSSNWVDDFGAYPVPVDVAVAQRAYDMAGITRPSEEIDWLALHDCSTQNWMTFSEDVGYYGPGEAWKAAMNGDMERQGRKPINTSGGRLGLGHPSAPANGVEIAEAVNQMRGNCGDRQMNNAPRTAVVQSVGGSWHFANTVLRAL